MAEGALCWFRVEWRGDGQRADIRAVDHVEQDGVQVYFVQATNQKQAARLAWNLYCKKRQQIRRAELAADGKCMWCARPNDREPTKRCSACLEAAKKYDERHRAKVAGLPVEPLDAKKTLAAKREQERDVLRREVRLEVLLELDAVWRNAANAWVVRQWLRKELEALTGKEVA